MSRLKIIGEACVKFPIIHDGAGGDNKRDVGDFAPCGRSFIAYSSSRTHAASTLRAAGCVGNLSFADGTTV